MKIFKRTAVVLRIYHTQKDIMVIFNQ